MSEALQNKDLEAVRIRYLNDGVIKMYLSKIRHYIELSVPSFVVDLNTMEMIYMKNEHDDLINRMKFELEEYISNEYGNYLKTNP